jgi:hypothetical protein
MMCFFTTHYARRARALFVLQFLNIWEQVDKLAMLGVRINRVMLSFTIHHMSQ